MITFDSTKSRSAMGIVYRHHRKTIVDMANDLIDKGLLPDKRNNLK
jgi:hypothetical protein